MSNIVFGKCEEKMKYFLILAFVIQASAWDYSKKYVGEAYYEELVKEAPPVPQKALELGKKTRDDLASFQCFIYKSDNSYMLLNQRGSGCIFQGHWGDKYKPTKDIPNIVDIVERYKEEIKVQCADCPEWGPKYGPSCRKIDQKCYDRELKKRKQKCLDDYIPANFSSKSIYINGAIMKSATMTTGTNRKDGEKK